MVTFEHAHQHGTVDTKGTREAHNKRSA